MKKGSILVVDDNKSVLSALRLLLGLHFEKVRLLNSPNTLISALGEEKPDVVLLDMNFSAGINSGNEGLFWLSEVKKFDPSIPVVLFTAYADIDVAVRALKEGASDFVVKPWNNAKLIETLRAAINPPKRSDKKADSGVPASADGDIYWGDSRVMQELLSVIEKVAATDANILITGENGTGKEVVARKIHSLSSRAARNMVSVDMGSLTETLFESELFGHVKGAFTDAKSDRAGKFEAADGSTLFLDEIGNIPLPLQAKLLVALQSRKIVRVGSNTPIPVDIRLISATNRNLEDSVAAGSFREDLLYRINTIQIDVPPLRERQEDIIPLAEFFLRRFSLKYGKSGMSFSDEAADNMQHHLWPGNVRELQHAVERAVILSNGSTIDGSGFYFSGHKPIDTSRASLDELERLHIERVLAECGGNISNAAAHLNISRPTLYNRMKKYGLI
jgi:DNA-binding NtrC family response regulator